MIDIIFYSLMGLIGVALIIYALRSSDFTGSLIIIAFPFFTIGIFGLMFNADVTFDNQHIVQEAKTFCEKYDMQSRVQIRGLTTVITGECASIQDNILKKQRIVYDEYYHLWYFPEENK